MAGRRHSSRLSGTCALVAGSWRGRLGSANTGILPEDPMTRESLLACAVVESTDILVDYFDVVGCLVLLVDRRGST